MTSMAFTFSTNDFEFVVLSGSKSAPVLKGKGKILLPANHNVSQTVGWFETELGLLINSYQPDHISYRLTIMAVKTAYVTNVFYAQGILNLLCKKRSIEINHTSPASIKPGKFGLTKETNMSNHIDGLFGKQPAPWDKGIKDSTLIALLNLS